MKQGPKNVVLLAAGSGSRLSPLTDKTHKALLPICGKPVLEYIFDVLRQYYIEEIVIVTGSKSKSIQDFIKLKQLDHVKVVHNKDHLIDTNILSAYLGVNALQSPEEGYLIIETDIVMDVSGWDIVLDICDRRNSFWVTRGIYNQTLTGGALLCNADHRVIDLVYAPQYQERYEGWEKLLGILYVGSNQVPKDIELRQRGVEQTYSQYYIQPWIDNIGGFQCYARNLGERFAGSFNDLKGYQYVEDMFAQSLNYESRF